MPRNEAAKRKVNKYRKTYVDNHSISFLPAIISTFARMHGEFLRLLFLQAHRETEEYFRVMGTPAQPDQDQFRFRRAAFYSSLKSKVGLIAAKAAALRINLNTDSCLVASRAAPRRLASSHATSLLNSSLSHHLPRPQPFSRSTVSTITMPVAFLHMETQFLRYAHGGGAKLVAT